MGTSGLVSLSLFLNIVNAPTEIRKVNWTNKEDRKKGSNQPTNFCRYTSLNAEKERPQKCKSLIPY